ncbi:MAG: sigma 54-interacting transcriptional regulator [Terriglobia bacterium]
MTPAILESIFKAAPDATIITDRDGVILRVNPGAERLFGYSRPELLGQKLDLLSPQFSPESKPFHPARTAPDGPSAGRDGGVADLYLRRKDGTEFPADLLIIPLDEQGCFLCAVRDVTGRRQREHELREREEQFRLLVQGVKDCAIFMLDPDGRISSWNAGAESIHGYSAKEVLEKHFRTFYPAEDAERGKPEEHLRLAGDEGEIEDEGWRLRKDGSRFWANVMTTALRDEHGRLRGFAQLTRDFTARKRAEDTLLLEITNVLVSNLDARELLNAIRSTLGQVAPHDYGALALHEPGSEVLRLIPLDESPGEPDPFHGGALLPIEGSPEGWAFARGEPLALHTLADPRFSRSATGPMIEAGMHSACFLPLPGRERTLGALCVARRGEGGLPARELNLLVQVANQIAIALDNALAFRRVVELKDKLAHEKLYLQTKLQTESSFDEIVGKSPTLRRILKQVETVAPTDATALILGETGTGKELIARAIHALSPRRGHIFVRFNCAAIPTGLLESELFGHEKGAFTGASAQRLGRLDLAHQGTLFLDEVGDIPLELQPKLLRALQEKEFERLGSTRTIPVDMRLIAATNRDLSKMVRAGDFRSDLYYRLKVFPIIVPPLRERREDIPLLVRYFVQKHAFRMNRRIETIPPEVMEALVQWDWPGNVRELGNFLERAVILTRGSILNVPLSELKSAPEEPSGPQGTLEAVEREHILTVLRETRGVIAGRLGAAARLGLKRSTLNSKMRKLGIARTEL